MAGAARAAGPGLLATDLDGTLVHNRAVSREDAEALLRWRAAGGLVVVATGRSATLARLGLADASKAAGVTVPADFIICASGTTVLDADGAVLRTVPVPKEVVRAVSERFAPREYCDVRATTLGDDYLVAIAGQWAVERPSAADAAPATPRGTDTLDVDEHFAPISLERLLDLDVTSMPLHMPDPAQADAAAIELLELGGGAIEAPRSHGFVDVAAAGQSKGVALRAVLELLAERGAPVGRTAAIGDSWNDISMLEIADEPRAMVGSPDVVVAAAGGRTAASVAELVDALLA